MGQAAAEQQEPAELEPAELEPAELEQAAGAPAGGQTLAGLLERAEKARGIVEVEVPLIGTVRLKPMVRAEHTDLPITESSDANTDQLHIVAATVLEPALTFEEWGTFRDAAPLGVWGSLVGAVLEANGLTPGFQKSEGARFRA